jgi:hypothetical protein
MIEPLILVCIEGAYSNGMLNDDGTYGLTQDLKLAYRYTKVQLDDIFQQFTDMRNLFDVVPVSKVR